MTDSQRPDLETEAADSNQNQTSSEEGASGIVSEAGNSIEGEEAQSAGADSAGADPDDESFDTDEDIPTPS